MLDAKKPIGSKTARVAVVVVLPLLLAPTTLSNRSDFSFTMEHHLVDGKKNQIVHMLAPGVLTISGSLWVTEVLPGALGPYDVTIQVNKMGNGFFQSDEALCKIVVAPSTRKDQKVPFSGSCGSTSGSIYLLVFKSNDDGRSIQAAGALVTERHP